MIVEIARVFPRRTNASPDDALAFFDAPGLFPVEADAVHISVTFTWDLPRAEQLAKAWERIATITIGGPATGEAGGDFVPGMYLKKGYVITSRGCPNRCWFCSVPKREGALRELPITEGCNVLDDNLLACSEKHVRDVFAMLKKQRLGRVQLTGGLEAARLRDWHVDLMLDVKPKQLFFAYDTPDDWEPLMIAAKKMRDAGLISASKRVRAYVLIGYPGDTLEKADERLNDTLRLGVVPMAMLWRSESGKTEAAWRKLRSLWMRPAMIKFGENYAKPDH